VRSRAWIKYSGAGTAEVPLRSHNILALLTQIAKDFGSSRQIDESPAFLELVGTESAWAEIFGHIDSITDFSMRHKLRGLELDYTVAYVRNQIQQVLPRSGTDIWALERTSYLTGLFSDAFNLWDEFCAALDMLEVDLRDELEARQLTPRKVKNRLHDMEFARLILGAMNIVLFEKTGLTGEEGAINKIESHSAQLVLCERVPGIPLSLAVIYLIVGVRLGFPIYGVNTPGRFLLKWQYEDLELFIDVFDKGSLVTRQDLETLMSHNLTGYSSKLLDPAPFEIMTRRSLANLTALAVRSEDDYRARKLESLSRGLFGF
jgi:regulator of sirC expression with transglutaminase-like and TPR domain